MVLVCFPLRRNRLLIPLMFSCRCWKPPVFLSPKDIPRVTSYWTVLEIKTRGRRLFEQTSQWLTFTFQRKPNNQDVIVRGWKTRMSNLFVLLALQLWFTILAENAQILLSHLTITLKIAPCVVSPVNARIHNQFSSNFSQPASIRLCTLCFRVLQCSMECPGAPPW